MSIAMPGALFAQQYRAPSDTLHYDSENSYLLYFVRGADTLGRPVITHTRESIVAAGGPGLRLSVTLRSLDGGSFRRTDTFTVSPAGRVLDVNGKSVRETPDARLDLFPRFPEPFAPIKEGTRWTDTVSSSAIRTYGSTSYSVQRTYTVSRILDSLGTRVAVLTAVGTMRLRQGGWQDSSRNLVWWQELAGPVADTAWFDTKTGQLLGDAANMDLSGRGAAGPRDAAAVMASGLRSRVRRFRAHD